MKMNLIVQPLSLRPVDILSQLHVGLEVFEFIADQVGDQDVLCHYLLLEDADFIHKVLNLSKLGHLYNHDIIGMTYPFHGLYNSISQALSRNNINQPTIS